MNAHMFRIEDTNHVILTLRNNVRRGKGHRAICGRPILADAMFLPPHQPGRSAPITCQRCLTAFTGFENSLDKDFGFTAEGQFGIR
jgi:hypothetical protein